MALELLLIECEDVSSGLRPFCKKTNLQGKLISHFCKSSYTFIAVHIKIITRFFVEVNKLILKFIGKCRTFLKEIKIGEFILVDLKTYSRTTIRDTVRLI